MSEKPPVSPETVERGKAADDALLYAERASRERGMLQSELGATQSPEERAFIEKLIDEKTQEVINLLGEDPKPTSKGLLTRVFSARSDSSDALKMAEYREGRLRSGMREFLREEASIEKLRERIGVKIEAIKSTLAGGALSPASSRQLKELYAEQEKLVSAQFEREKNDPEIFVGSSLLTLRQYQQDLTKGELVVTKSVEKAKVEIEEAIKNGQPLFIHGHLGAGKTEVARKVANEFIQAKGGDEEVVVISGSKKLTSMIFFGKRELKEGEKGAPETIFVKGPVYEAMIKGYPIIVDEADAIPHDMLIALNHILTRRPGDEVRIQEDSGERIVIQPGFNIIFTGNFKAGDEDSLLYVGRQAMDAAFISRFELMKYDYVPQSKEFSLENATDEERAKSELFHILVAQTMDRYGSALIPAEVIDSSTGAAVQEGGLSQLWKLAVFASRTQDVLKGEYGSDSKLQERMGKNVCSLRHLGRIIEPWKKEQKYNLEHYLFEKFIAKADSASAKWALYVLAQECGFFALDKGWPAGPDLQNSTSGGGAFTLENKSTEYGASEVLGPRDIVYATFGKGPVRTEFPEFEIEQESQVVGDLEKVQDMKDELAKQHEKFKALKEKAARKREKEQKAAGGQVASPVPEEVAS